MSTAASQVKALRKAANDAPANQDPDAERAWIGFVFAGAPSAVAAVVRETGIRPEHLFSGSAAAAFGVACSTIAEGGEPTISAVSAFQPALASWLRDELAAWYAGPDSLRTGGLIARENARLLIALAQKRSALRELDRARGLVEAGRPSADVAAHLQGLAGEMLRGEAPEERPQLLHTAGHFVDALEAMHRAPRLSTGIESLDAACNGGLPFPRLVVIGGAPGAGKTTLAAQMGLRWAQAGYFVAFLSVDEGPEGVVARIMQAMGFSLDDGSWTAAQEAADALPIWLCDGAPVEAFAAEAHERAATEGRKLVLLVDSIQTVNARGASDAENAKARVDAVVAALKQEAKRAMVLATCELARGSYRSKNSAEQSNDLAAFKESGAVEYAMQTGLVLRSEPGEGDLVTVTIPKNRGARHTKPTFRLKLHRPAATFHEVAIEEPEEQADAFAGDAHARAKAAILRTLANDHGIKSKSKLATAIGGRTQVAMRAVDELTERRLVVIHGGVYRLASEVCDD